MNKTTCYYSTYSSKDEIINDLKNKGINSINGCVKKNKSYCGALATACYDWYICTKG